jgi:hypothetical protein
VRATALPKPSTTVPGTSSSSPLRVKSRFDRDLMTFC